MPNVSDTPDPHLDEEGISVFSLFEDDYEDDDPADAPEGYRQIQSWDFKDPRGPIGAGPLFFGAELEVEAINGHSCRDRADCVMSFCDAWACAKHDGSLNNGFEIVSRPMEYEMTLRRWLKLLNVGFRNLRSWKTSSCGMHVHVSRRPLTQLQIAKMLVFINSPRAEKLVTAVAGRYSTGYSRVKNKQWRDARGGYNSDRYEMVNLQNDNTVEFRIFKGTLSPFGFARNLQFVKAMVDFTAPASGVTLAQTQSPTSFLSFVLERQKEYPELFRQLVTRSVYNMYKVGDLVGGIQEFPATPYLYRKPTTQTQPKS